MIRDAAFSHFKHPYRHSNVTISNTATHLSIKKCKNSRYKLNRTEENEKKTKKQDSVCVMFQMCRRMQNINMKS